ncbi:MULTISPECIES: DUF1648 domain-containing protein [unclassified Streptomyces]|uniref:DUF1648 domain-containing protein n=1 Tax=unclassified Streptomyces TaxID=2593676 RepID=UPI0016614266|nr:MULTISPECIES: DUF1648 domain-containing protein [unclassified Streptomyces]MBD0709063.1 hypothetical protein [Streptomyces sp. CBMA291]MBD0716213.1 hypothetical protein [Streptomyces sp. CBMA370]
MTRSTLRLRVLTALPFVLTVATYLLFLALRWDRLPETLATHFGPDGGRPDGFTGRTAFAIGGTVLLVVLGATWTALARRGSLWGAWATAGFTGALLLLLVRDNLDAVDPARVESSPAGLLLVFAAAVALGLLGWALTRLVPRDERAVPRAAADGPRLPLGAGEVARWSHSAASRPLTVLAVLSLAATPAVLLLAPWPGALFALLGLVVGVTGLALARVLVTVDRHGLTVRSSLFTRPRVRIPLEEVAGADVRDLDTKTVLAQYGGWGYRVRAHRTGVIVRTGEALVVRRTSGREFAVTVPDAGTAAALLNTLAERRGKV